MTVASKLITAPAELIALADAKLHLRVDHSEDDAAIASMITAARESCEHRTGRAIGAQTWRVTMDEFPTGAIRVPVVPVSGITSVQYIDTAGTLQTMAPADYVLDDASDLQAWLHPAVGTTWPATMATANAVRVTYACGLTTLPGDLRHWMLLQIGALFAHREAIGMSGRAAELPGRFVDGLLDRHWVPEV